MCWREENDPLERIDPIIDVSPVFAQLARDRRLLQLASCCVGGPDPVLIKDKLVLKKPGSDGYKTHQDAGWWPWVKTQQDRKSLVNIALFIDPADRSNGALELFPGDFSLLSTQGEARNLNDVENRKLQKVCAAVSPTCNPGDALSFTSLTPHRSEKNCSERARRVLYFTFGPVKGPVSYMSFQNEYVALCRSYLPKDTAHLYKILSS
eukprot:g9566.t1